MKHLPQMLTLKKSLLVLFALACLPDCLAQASDSLVKRLDYAIAHKEQYARVKEKRISRLKANLLGNLSRNEEYLTNDKLYSEYRKFKIDSAKYYVRRNIELAELLKNPDLGNKARIQLANLYSSSGNFLEAQTLLQTIRSKELPTPLKALYYEFYSQFYEHYATNNPSKVYTARIETYRDSLLRTTDKNSNKYKINLAQHYISTNHPEKAKKILNALLEKSTARDPDYVMCVYLLGDILHWQEHKDGVEYYYLAAISDIENAIKDNAAIQSLAIYHFDKGQIDLANKYAQSAIEDAVFCNVKFRTLALSEFYSIVNTAYKEQQQHNKSQLQLYLILISVLTVFLIVAVVYVYRQMKRVSNVKEELSVSARQLELLNAEILEANAELHESNRVKEEYIAQFFDICSSYIDKLEDYRKKLNIKAVNKQFEDLARVLKSNDFTQTELQELYRNFDVVFVNLYPTFIEEFNELLIPEERHALKEGEILSAEMRIFALERLGIRDSVKIASFLRFSVSTIYNYRTKIRNKSLLPREEFEARIQKLGNKSE